MTNAEYLCVGLGLIRAPEKSGNYLFYSKCYIFLNIFRVSVAGIVSTYAINIHLLTLLCFVHLRRVLWDMGICQWDMDGNDVSKPQA